MEQYDIDDPRTHFFIEYSENDAYTFLKILGSGSFGDVWLAEDENGVKVAIKSFKVHNSDTIDDFNHEFESLTNIKDKCDEFAVCILDSYEKNGLFRIVFNYIDGLTLEHYIKITSNRTDLQILKDLVIGLYNLHKLNITHQDIKLENIMWDINAKKYKFVDWGIACLKKYCDNDAPCADIYCKTSGTLYTMPPSFRYGYNNNNTFSDTIAHDIWSVGVVLFIWYTATNDEIKTKSYFDLQINNWSQTKIYNEINDKISDYFVKSILTLILVVDKKERLENWDGIVKLVSEYFDSDL